MKYTYFETLKKTKQPHWFRHTTLQGEHYGN